jgi:hypothetical protein
MPAFRKIEEYQPEPVALTENRKALAELIAERDIARDAANAESESSARLGTVHADVEPARAALQAFDAQQSVAWSNWSRGLVTGKPVADASRRAQLVADLDNAELASAAATAAQAECQINAERLAHKLTKMEADIRERAKAVMIEEATELLLSQMRDAIARAEALRHRLDAVRAEAIEGAQYGRPSLAGPAIERFDIARRAAEERPFSPPVNPHILGWKKYVAGLTQDAAIDFDGAQAVSVTLAPVHITTIDPVTAASRAVDAFPTNNSGWN